MAMNNTTNWQGHMLGRYSMIRVLGRGGMGEVWLAEDTQLRRQVAIKMLPSVFASEQNYLQDFAYEARTAAALEHPHILPVHDYGKQENSDEVFTYLVMPYIRGGSLRERMQLNNGLLSQSESLHYLRQAAQAIDYAHSKGVLHRDIKPANMLLEQDWLLLADFGIAKLLTSATYRSRTHSGAGTPEYMAPEQAQGKADAASDLYSLAVVAYRLFTGRAPFQGESPYDILIKHIRETPTAPRQLNPALPQMVDSALLQGLAKRPEERPASCTAFVDGLERGWQIQRLQQVDPEATLPAPWNTRFQENAAFLPTVMPSSQPLNQQMPPPPTVVDRMPPPQTGPAANFQSGNLPQTPYQSGSLPQTPYQAGQWNQPAPTQPAQEAKGKVGRRNVLIGGTIVAAAAIVGGFTLPTILHHATTTPPAAKKAIPGPSHLIPGVPMLSLTGHSDEVWNAIWDPTGRYLATAGQDTRIMLWDIGNLLQKNTGSFQSVATPLKSWKLSGEIYSNQLCWSGDGRFLLATFIGDNDTNNVSLLNPFNNDTNPIAYTNASLDNNLLPTYGPIACPPNTTAFAVARSSPPTMVKIDMWKPDKTNVPFKTFSGNVDSVGVSVIAWSLDGKMLAASTENSKVVVWEASTGAIKQEIDLPDRTTDQSVIILRNALAWSPIHPDILLVSNLDVVNVWNVPQKKLLYTLGTDDPDALTPPKNSPFKWHPNVLGITWSPNGRYIVSGYGRSAKMYLWDLQNSSPTIKNGVRMQDAFIPASNGAGGHNGTVIDAEWSPNGRYVASASGDKTVIIWKVDQ